MDLQTSIARLRHGRAARGWSAATLATKAIESAAARSVELDLTQQAVSYFENGKTKTVPNWVRYALLAIEGETDNGASNAILLPTLEAVAEQFDLVPLAEVDISYGMGAAFMDDAPTVTVHQFPKEWLASISASPSSCLFIARGRGSSMEPTLRDGDMLIIDRSERQVRDQDELWAFTIGDIGMIKRLRVRGEKVTILSDSSVVPEDYAHPDEINVVGRVIFIGRRM